MTAGSIWLTVWSSQFPQVAAGEVIDNITRNRQAADAFGLDEAEHLPTVETMTQYQMMRLSGEVPDNARYKRGWSRPGDVDGGPGIRDEVK